MADLPDGRESRASLGGRSPQGSGGCSALLPDPSGAVLAALVPGREPVTLPFLPPLAKSSRTDRKGDVRPKQGEKSGKGSKFPLFYRFLTAIGTGRKFLRFKNESLALFLLLRASREKSIAVLEVIIILKNEKS